MKGIYWRTITYFQKKCDLPNKSKLHIVQLHAVYMDVPYFSKLSFCQNVPPMQRENHFGKRKA